MGGQIADRIIQLLHEKDITQKELSAAAGITESAVSHYIKGDRVPRGVNLVKIAKALGTTTDYLLGQDGGSDKESDLQVIKTLIARNAETMTKQEKIDLVSILISED